METKPLQQITTSQKQDMILNIFTYLFGILFLLNIFGIATTTHAYNLGDWSISVLYILALPFVTGLFLILVSISQKLPVVLIVFLISLFIIYNLATSTNFINTTNFIYIYLLPTLIIAGVKIFGSVRTKLNN